MAKKDVKGVHVRKTGNKSWEKAYTKSDLEVVYRRGHWNSWGEMIRWLETEGEKDNELTPGEVITIVEDLRRLERTGAQFTNDPDKAWDMATSH